MSESPSASRKVFRPAAVIGCIVLCVLVFVVDYLSSRINSGTFGFSAYGWPSVLGMKDSYAIADGQWYRLLTANFLHADFTHILFNMFSMYMWGRYVELLYGHGRTVMILLMAGLATTCVSFALSSGRSLGASGMVFGLMGALLAFGKYNRPMYRRFFGGGMTVMVILNLAYGFFTSNVDNFGHVGGLLGGYLAARCLGILMEPRFTWKSALACAGYAALIIVTLAIGRARWGA